EVDTSTGTVVLRAICPNTNEDLWPGQFVSVTLRIGVLTNATVVPSQAVQVSQNGDYVFVVDSDYTVEKRPVTVGPQWDGYTVITRGVVPGETVVTDGHLRLLPGSTIKLSPPASAIAMAGLPRVTNAIAEYPSSVPAMATENQSRSPATIGPPPTTHGQESTPSPTRNTPAQSR
ncbi:MAG: efflux RND transporter periplasmic adaptor subunit, partial [Verrucomicrobiae bacterium]|nr:efflux RND transporter periplasmic adaptor subunit [Verrucomicrobiae bacterium]